MRGRQHSPFSTLHSPLSRHSDRSTRRMSVRSGGICCIMHLLLCITLHLGTDPSATRLVPRRSGRNDGVVGQ
ncbi:MAG: hypothetical protein LBF81_06245 [Prevotellaceae bacterium]|nr:hypothetical protein [Prevotellaceae bacterium]